MKTVKFQIQAVYLTTRKGSKSEAVANVYYVKPGVVNKVYAPDGVTVLSETTSAPIEIKHGMGIDRALYDQLSPMLMETVEGKSVRKTDVDKYPTIGLALYHEVGNPDGTMKVTERTETWADDDGVEQTSTSRWISTRDV